MKVLCLNQYYAPAEATARFLADVAEDLAGAGHEVTVVCGNRSYPEPDRFRVGREDRRGVTVWRIRTTAYGRSSRFGRLVDYFTLLLGATLRLPRLDRPDVVVSMTTPPMIKIWPLPMS